MTDKKFIKMKIEEQIAVVTLDNPPVNILTSEVLRELDQTMDEIDKSDQVKVVVFTAAGTMAFIAGADIKEIAQIQGPDKARELALIGQAVISKFENTKKITIAAIHGVCVGGGMELVMAFHMRMASERAKFGQPEINLGIIPGFGGTQRLVRLVGIAKAREIILTGDMVNAQDALRLGLVNRVVPDGELIKQTMGLAKKIAAKSKIGIEQSERAMREGMKGSLADGLKLEAEAFAEVAKSEDMKEGVKAFIEKRQPKFQDK